MTEPTPVQPTPVNVDPSEVVAAHIEQQKLRIAAATTQRSGQRSTAGVRRIVVNKPSKAEAPAKPRAVRTGVKSSAKRTTTAAPAKPAAVSISQAEQKKLVEQSMKVQQELIDEAKQALGTSDLAQWKVAALSFKATQEDGPAKMDQAAWAQALGVSAPTVSRWVKVHAEYGLPTARQSVGKGPNKRELSFNDHLEMLKRKDDKATHKAILAAVLANGTSYATELKRSRDAAKDGHGTKNASTDSTAALINRVTAGEDDRAEAFQTLAQAAVNGLLAFAQAWDGISSEDVDEKLKTIAMTVVDQGLQIETAFKNKLAEI